MKNKSFYFWGAFYKIILEIVYVKVVSPAYQAYGLIWFPNMRYFLLSYFLFFLLMYTLPKGQDRPSHQLAQLLFFTTLVPILSFFWQSNQGLIFTLYVTLCGLLLFILLRAKSLEIPLILSTTRVKSFDSFSIVILVISLLSALFFTFRFGGIDVRAFNFESVYDLREDRDYTGIWGYLLNWTTKLLIPFTIVSFFIQKRKLLFLFSCILQVYFYLSTGSKSILFSVALLSFTTFLLKKQIWKTGVAKLYSFIILGATTFYFLTGYLMIIALFPTRQLILPAQIGIFHYNFFSENPKLYLSEGTIGKFLGFESPYSITSTFLVSPIPGVNWNTGFFGDAYDNGGLFFMLLYTFLLGLILLYIDSVSYKSKERYKYTAFTVYSIIIMNDGSLLTTLFTWGFGFLLIFMYITASQERENELLQS